MGRFAFGRFLEFEEVEGLGDFESSSFEDLNEDDEGEEEEEEGREECRSFLIGLDSSADFTGTVNEI